jgi:type IV secretory pathway ATPase VirB11/archaellum biosynthesis ATPase
MVRVMINGPAPHIIALQDFIQIPLTPSNLVLVIVVISAMGLAIYFMVIRRSRARDARTVEEEKRTNVPEKEPTVLQEYVIDDLIKVRIVRDGDVYKYLVSEPELDDELKRVVEKVEEAYIKKGVEPLEILKELSKKFNRDEMGLKSITYYILRDLKGGWKLEPLIRDERLEDITVTRPGPAYVIHREYPDVGWIETNIVFTAEELDRQVRLLAERNGAELSIAKPSVEVMTNDGDRIALTYAGELTPGTSTVTIRKFPRSPYTIIDLIRRRTISEVIAAYLWTMMEEKKFVLIAGPTGSGKTTLLSSLLQLLPIGWKILTLEDYHPEINLSWHRNWHRFVTRRTLGETAYSLADILRLSLRHRPDYTVVGEVRGTEAQVMFSAAATGHGMASTIHADSLEDVYQRLTSVSMGVPKDDLSFLDVVVLIRSTPRGRRVLYVWEIERAGRENLVAWYDIDRDRFFPETWVQLALASPSLTRNEGLRDKFERRYAMLVTLLKSGERWDAGRLAAKVEELRRSYGLVVA